MGWLLAGEKINLGSVSQTVTFQNAVTQPYGLSYFNKHHRQHLQVLLGQIIRHGCESFNVNMNLTVIQLSEVISLLTSEYYYLRPEEVVLVFKRAKMGEYGKVAFAIDISVIMGWFKTYAAQREQYFIGKNAEMRPDTAHANILAYGAETAVIKDPETGEEKQVSKSEIGEGIKEYWAKMKRVADYEKWQEEDYKAFEREYYKTAVRTEP